MNWNQLYTGNGYHSAGLRICEDEDIQGFSDALGNPTGKSEGNSKFSENINKLKDAPTDLPVLASNKTNPHATFVHYTSNKVTPIKDSPNKKKVSFQDDPKGKNVTLDNNLFRFFNDSNGNESNV